MIAPLNFESTAGEESNQCASGLPVAAQLAQVLTFLGAIGAGALVGTISGTLDSSIPSLVSCVAQMAPAFGKYYACIKAKQLEAVGQFLKGNFNDVSTKTCADNFLNDYPDCQPFGPLFNRIFYKRDWSKMKKIVKVVTNGKVKAPAFGFGPGANVDLSQGDGGRRLNDDQSYPIVIPKSGAEMLVGKSRLMDMIWPSVSGGLVWDPVNKRMGTVFAHDIFNAGYDFKSRNRGQSVGDSDDKVTISFNRDFGTISGVAHSVSFQLNVPILGCIELTLNFAASSIQDWVNVNSTDGLKKLFTPDFIGIDVTLNLDTERGAYSPLQGASNGYCSGDMINNKGQKDGECDEARTEETCGTLKDAKGDACTWVKQAEQNPKAKGFKDFLEKKGVFKYLKGISYSLGVASVITGDNFKCGMDEIRAGQAESGDVCMPCNVALDPTEYGYVFGDPIFQGLFPKLSEGTMVSVEDAKKAKCLCNPDDERMKAPDYDTSLYKQFCDECAKYPLGKKPAYCKGTVN